MRHWLGVMLAAGAVVAGGHLLLAGSPAGRGTMLLLAGVAAIAAVLVAVARRRPSSGGVWFVLAAALAVFVAGDAVRLLELVAGAPAPAQAANAVYGLVYLLLAVALVPALRRVAVAGGRELAIDGAVLAVAATLVLWPYLFRPRLDAADGVLALVGLTQPVGDVVVLAALGGAFVSAGRLRAAERLLFAALVTLFAGNVLHAAAPAWSVPVAVAEAVWVYAYVLFAASVLHPSMRELGSRPAARTPRRPRRRLAVVASAGLVTPGLLAVEAAVRDVETVVVAAGATVFSALVIVRLALLVFESDRLRERAELTEGRLRMLFEASPVGVSLPPDDDPLSGRLAYTNRALQEMLGYSGEELAQLDWRDVTLGAVRPEDERLRAELLAGSRQSYRIEKTYRRKDGSAVPAEVQVSLARAEDGSPLLAIGLIEDVTERKRAERELVESEQRFRDLLGGIEAMVWECSVGDWGYTFVSGGVEKLLGFPVDDWLADGDFWVDRLHPDDRERVIGRARDGELRGEDWAIEYRLLHADGRPVWVRDLVHIVRGPDGRPERLRGVLIDITASKEAEEERELLLDQLRQKQKVEALGQLAGGVAHDFNNLLTAITGYGELALARAAGDPALVRHLGEIRRSADRAAALTRQLLAFGRRQILSPRVIDLNEVVEGMKELVLSLVGDAVQLRLELDETQPRAAADPNQIEQVLMNLAVNARDAMPHGGLLSIRTGRRAVTDELASGEDEALPAGEYATLAVSDRGAGMPDAVRRRAFDPFFTTKAPGEGTGLGLSTVYGIVRQSGGHVVLESEPEAGTTVTVLLPLTSRPAAEPAAEPEVAPAAGGLETVLLVEDEPAVRAVIEAALEEDGFHLLTAADGLEALEVAAAHTGAIDLLVSDVSMPRMGGLELLRRYADERPGTPALLITGYAESVPDGVPLLRKPFGLGELRDAVRRTLADSRAEAA